MTGVEDDDGRDEEDVTVTHAVDSADPDYDELSVDNLIVTVTDDDTHGVTILGGPLTVTEGGTGTYTVVLDTEPTGDVTVTPSIVDTGAVTVSAALTFSMSDWNTSQTVTVTGVEDDDGRDEEDVTVTHAVDSADPDYDELSVDNLIVTVTDDDTHGVTILGGPLTVTEGGTGTYTVVLDTEPTGDVTVTPSIVDTGAVTVSAALTFSMSDWNTSQTVTVTGVKASTTAVTVSHAVAGSDYRSVSAPPLSVTVVDDSRGVTTLVNGLSASELSVNEGNTATYEVKLKTRPSGNVMLLLNNVPDILSLVTLSCDLPSFCNVLRFTPENWDIPQTVTVTGREDDDDEDGTVTVSYTAFGANYNGVSAELTVKVMDDDVPYVRVSEGPLTVIEGDTNNYTVVLDTKPRGNVTITPSSGDTGAATVSAALTFSTSDWNTSQTVVVSGVEDDDGKNENFELTHTASGANYSGVPVNNLTVTVTDDDTRRVTITPSLLKMTEEGTGNTGTYTVRLETEPVDGDVTITPSSDNPGGATVSAAVLTFNKSNWDEPQTLTVTGVEDDDTEDETVTVTHTVEGADYNDVTANDVEVQVKDNDTPDVTISASLLTVTEEDTGPYTVVLDTEPTGNVTITPNSDDTGAATVSAALTFTTSNWNTAQTVTVTGVEDDDGNNENVTVTHTVAGADYNDVAADDLTLTVKVTDNDTPRVVISTSELMISEAGSGVYDVKLNTSPVGNVIIMPDNAQNKVTLSPTTLIFNSSSWNTAQTVTVTGKDNDNPEPNGKIVTFVNHTVAGYTSMGADRVTVTVKDDDTVPAKPKNLTARHGGAGKIVLKWDNPNDATITAWEVQYQEGPLGDWTGIAWEPTKDSTITTTTHTVENLTNKTKYYFRIRAENASGYGPNSEEQSGTPLAPKTRKAGSVIVPLKVRVVESGRSERIGLTESVRPGTISHVTVHFPEIPESDVTVRATFLSTELFVHHSTGIFTFTREQWRSDPSMNMPIYALNNDTENKNTKEDLSIIVTGGGYSDSKTVSVEIVDNEAENLVVSRNKLSLKEGEHGNYFVSLSKEPTTPVRVTIKENPSTNDLTLSSEELTISPLPLIFTPENWNTLQTVTVTTTPDSDGSNDTVKLIHKAKGGNYTSVTPVSLTVTVVEPVEISPTGQSLGSGLAMMAAPAGVTVTPTELTVTEATGPANAATYTVVLDSQPTGGGVTVTPASADTQAAALSPNTALTFTDTNWSLPQTVTVLGVVDADNHHETVTVSHSVAGANYNNLRTDSVKVTVVDAEAAQQDAAQAAKAQAANLAATSRTMLGMATDVLGARTAKDRAMAGGDGGSIGEQAWGIVEHLLGSSGNEFSSDLDLEGIEDRLWSQSFQLVAPGTGQEDGSPSDAKGSWAFWGAGELRSYRGDAEDNISYSGNLKTAWLGIDHLFTDQWLAGLALSTSSGESDYSYQKTTGDTDGGKVTTRLTAFYPYGSLQLTERLRLWGLVGLGFGNQNHQPNDGGDSAEGELRLQMGVIGFTQQLDTPGALQLALAGDVGLAKATTDWEAGSGLDDLDISLTRARLGVDTSFPLATHTTGHLSVKGRMDWGALEMGAAELLAGFHYHSGRFSASLQGLQVYAFDGDYTESGITAQLQFSTRPDGTGLAWTLQPSYGSDDGALALADGLALWSDEQLATLTGSDTQQRRQLALSSRMGYGIRLQDRDLLLTPFTELRFSKEGSRSLGLGLSMETTSWDVELTGSAEGSGGNPATGKVQLIFSTKL